MSSTLFIVGPCKVVGYPENVTVRRLTRSQYAAAKVVLLTLGLTHEEMDDLTEQLCQERHYRDIKRQVRHGADESLPQVVESMLAEPFGGNPLTWQELADHGQKLDAVRAYRAECGEPSLLESMKAVEKYLSSKAVAKVASDNGKSEESYW